MVQISIQWKISGGNRKKEMINDKAPTCQTDLATALGDTLGQSDNTNNYDYH